MYYYPKTAQESMWKQNIFHLSSIRFPSTNSFVPHKQGTQLVRRLGLFIRFELTRVDWLFVRFGASNWPLSTEVWFSLVAIFSVSLFWPCSLEAFWFPVIDTSTKLFRFSCASDDMLIFALLKISCPFKTGMNLYGPRNGVALKPTASLSWTRSSLLSGDRDLEK